MTNDRLIIPDVKEQVEKELELYKYPYDTRAKLLRGIILLLELYEEEQPRINLSREDYIG